jgi:hypothetical protein
MISYLATATLAFGMLAASSQPKTWQTSYGKALASTKAANAPLLVVLDKPKSEDARVSPALLGEANTTSKELQLLRPYTLCHVDVTTEYGQKVASAFRARTFPHVAIIDKTGSRVLFRTSGDIEPAEWEQFLSRHKTGERARVRPVSQTSYQAAKPVIYSDPMSFSGSYCPSCQRQSF